MVKWLIGKSGYKLIISFYYAEQIMSGAVPSSTNLERRQVRMEKTFYLPVTYWPIR